jgi:hypothetical protein
MRYFNDMVGGVLDCGNKQGGKGTGRGGKSGLWGRLERFLAERVAAEGCLRGPVCEGLEARQVLSGGSPVDLVGAPLILNENTADTLADRPKVGQADDGSFVAVWGAQAGDGSVGIMVRRYEADGTPLGAESMVVSGLAASGDFELSVAVAGNGSFVVVWTDYVFAGTSGFDVHGQMFDSSGNASGAAFMVNTTTTGAQQEPSLAMAGDGSFVVTWTGPAIPGGVGGIFGQRFASDGSKAGGEFSVPTSTQWAQNESRVAMAEDGSFVMVWQSTPQDGHAYGVYGRRFDAAGGMLGDEFRVNTSTMGSQWNPGVGMNADGSYVVVWQGGLGFDGPDIFGRRYDSEGNALGDEFVVNARYTTGEQSQPSVRMGEEGSFLVVWEGENEFFPYGIIGQYFDGDGETNGRAFKIAASDEEVMSVIAGGRDNAFVTAWYEYNGKSVIKAQRLVVVEEGLAAESIPMVALRENGVGQTIDLDAYFPEQYVLAGLTYEIVGNSNKGLLEAAISSEGANELVISLLEDAYGTGVITVRATDGEGAYADAVVFVGVEASDERLVTPVGAGANTVGGSINDSDISMAGDGSYVVVRKGAGILGRRYGADGTALGAEFEIISGGTLLAQMPAVSSAMDGSFVVTWVQGVGNTGVYARRYDASGNAQGAAFLVNTYSDGYHTTPDVAVGADGRFVVVWESDMSFNDLPALWGQQYDGQGMAVGGRFQISDYLDDPTDAAVAMGPDNSFVVTWVTDDTVVFAKKYDWDGTSGASFQANPASVSGLTQPTVAIGGNGNFVVAWTGFGNIGAQMFSADGTPLGKAFDPAVTSGNRQSQNPGVTMGADGSLVVGWTGYKGTTTRINGVYVQRFDAAGKAVGSVLEVSGVTSRQMLSPSVAGSPSGDFAITWHDKLKATNWRSFEFTYPNVAPEFEGFEPMAATTTAAVGWVDVYFSEAINVDSFDWESVTLTRDGGANLIDASTGAGLELTLVNAGTNRYRIDGLGGLTRGLGDYVLTLVDGGVADPEGKSMGAGGQVAWERDVAVPSAPVLGSGNPGPYEAGYTSSTTPTVTGTGTPGNTVEFYDQADQLLGTTTVGVDGLYAFTFGTLGLGNYQVKARVAGDGFATSYSSLATFHVANKFVSALQITQFPATVTAPVTAVGLQFSGALDLASFTWEDLDIRINGTGPNLTNSGINIVRVSPTSLWYRIDLPAAMTVSSGTYTLQVKRAGVNAADGKPIFNNVSTTWTRKYNFAQINQFTTPVPTPMTAVGFQSSVELDLANLTWQDIELTRNGGPDLSMSGITIERVSPTSLWYRVNLPASLSVLGGTYAIKIKGAGVLDMYGNPMGNDISTTWIRNSKLLQITAFPTPVSASVTAVGFQSAVVLDLANLTWEDIELTRDGGADLSMSGITIDRPSSTSLWYRINIPSSLSVPSGVYTLKVKGGGILDMSGNPVGDSLTTTWTRNYQFAQINQFPTPVSTSMTLVGFQSTVELTLASLTSSSIRLTLNDGPNLATGAITFERVSPTSLWYRIKLPPSMTVASGAYKLTVVGANVLDVYGHAMGGDLTTTWTKV